jgi:hypothetical protein
MCNKRGRRDQGASLKEDLLVRRLLKEGECGYLR